MTKKESETIHQSVRKNYSKIAKKKQSSCCGPSSNSNCLPTNFKITPLNSTRLGYSPLDLKKVPVGADMGLGCGNPFTIANLKLGETVLDLGSGGGIDCFLAAAKVGETGKVIGVDMTAAMISKARFNAQKSNLTNVEFRLGEIEHLPVADHSIDVIISNCVINLSPNKDLVFLEAFRVLKPGGRLAISDIVTSAPLPKAISEDLSLHSACIAGASPVAELEEHMKKAGFTEILITPKDESRSFIKDWAPGSDAANYVVSANIEAKKPI